MARIAGVDLPPNKRIEIGLTYIYGIGRPQSNNILQAAGVSPNTKVRELNDEEVNKIRYCSSITFRIFMMRQSTRSERLLRSNTGSKVTFGKKFLSISNG